MQTKDGCLFEEGDLVKHSSRRTGKTLKGKVVAILKDSKNFPVEVLFEDNSILTFTLKGELNLEGPTDLIHLEENEVNAIKQEERQKSILSQISSLL